MPTQPAQLLDPAEFKPLGKAGEPKAGQGPREPVPALEREALSETGRVQPKRNAATPACARSGEVSPMAREGTREHAGTLAKAVDKASAAGKSTETAAHRRTRRDEDPTKLFMLDTNALMHDPTSLFRSEEHDVYLPMMMLEELDDHKKGVSEVARNARMVSRTLDQLVAGTDGVMDDGLPLAKFGNRDTQGRLFFQTCLNDIRLPDGLPQGKADNQILGTVTALQQQRLDRFVVLVSKDINMRIKAHALGLPAEDYFSDRVLEDTDLLYSGIMVLSADFWQEHGKNIESWQDPETGTTLYHLSSPLAPSFLVNQLVFLEPNNGSLSLYARVKKLNGKTAVLQTLKDYTHQRNNVWGVAVRNREQNFALGLLIHLEMDLVSLFGQTGTGKTLLAPATGLEQVLDQKFYNEIIITRTTVPVGGDIGFLPGTEEEKMQPWMGAFDDNLEMLQKSDDNAGEWGRATTQELTRSRIKVKSTNFIQGRTFVNKFLIIDEAQNLTPKQMKTLVTCAGPGTKIVYLGNIAQIDTPYLTEGLSGLTYIVDHFKNWSHSGYVTFARGEHSRLADHASDVL